MPAMARIPRRKDLVRLDLEELAKKDLGGYHAIDPKDLEESELLYRIIDEEDPMPPEDFGKTLSKKEQEIIRQWVLSGAEYEEHWSFVPPTKAGIEPVGNPIDHFIDAKLKEEGTNFGKEADRATLARRASLILNGLPPEPADLNAFLKDNDEGAYEQVPQPPTCSQRLWGTYCPLLVGCGALWGYPRASSR